MSSHAHTSVENDHGQQLSAKRASALTGFGNHVARVVRDSQCYRALIGFGIHLAIAVLILSLWHKWITPGGQKRDGTEEGQVR
jgi:hypothetical protein